MKQKLSPLIIGALVGLVVIGLMRFGMSLGGVPARAGAAGRIAGATGVAAKTENGVQRATIGFSTKTFNYEPSVIRLKRGMPAEITLDIPTLENAGCMAVVISRPFGLQLVAQEGQNVARFTPEKSGTFAFACPMGMGRGKFIVEE